MVKIRSVEVAKSALQITSNLFTGANFNPAGLIIEALLAFIIVFSPLNHGSVGTLPLSIVEAASFAMLFVLAFSPDTISRGRISIVRVSAIPLFLFTAFILLQVVPFTVSALEKLSPNTMKIFTDFAVESRRVACLSIYADLTVRSLIQFLSYSAVLLSVLNYLDTEEKVKRLVLLIIASGLAYSIYGIFNREPAVPPSEFSTFLNRDHFAAYLEMIVFLCLGYSLANARKSSKIAFIFVASIIAIALFLTASRGGRVCFLISLLVFYSLIALKRPMNRVVIAATLLLIFLSAFTLFIGPGTVFQRMETLVDPLGAYKDRFDTLVDSCGIIKDFPVFGTGFGTFIEIAQKYKTTKVQATYGFSHCEPAQLLAEVGIIGTLLFLFFLLSILCGTLNAWIKRKRPFAVYVTAGCIAGIFSITIHSFMDFMFHIPANAVLFFIILALAYRCAHIADEGVASEVRRCDIFISKPFLIPFFAGLLLILLFSEYAIFRRCHADMIFQRNKDEKVVSTGSYAALEYRRLFAEINNAITMNLGDSRYMCRKGDLASELILRRDLYDKLRIIGPLKNIDGMIVVADKSYSKAVTLNPTNADYHLKLGWLYSIAGDLDGMKKEFKKAWILDPTNINLRKYINEYMTELQQ